MKTSGFATVTDRITGERLSHSVPINTVNQLDDALQLLELYQIAYPENTLHLEISRVPVFKPVQVRTWSLFDKFEPINLN